MPALQVRQVVSEVALAASEEVPSGQFSVDVVVGQYWPGAQALQSASDVAPVSNWVVPSGQFAGVADASGQ